MVELRTKPLTFLPYLFFSSVVIVISILLSPRSVESSVKVEHVGINSRPTFSYIIVQLSKDEFDFSSSKRKNIINVIIKNAEFPEGEKEIRTKDKIVKKVVVREIKGKMEKYVVVSVITKGEKWEWNATRFDSKIVVFVGKDIPFTEKRDLEEYMRDIVETRNYRALNFLFSLAETTEGRIKALALFHIGELVFQMAVEGKSRLLFLRSANYYGSAGRVFLRINEIDKFMQSYFLSSQAFRWAGFYPEAKNAAEISLIKAIEKKLENPTHIAGARCSLALALVGMYKAGKASEEVSKLEKINPEKIKSDEVADCYWSALGVVEYEKGHFTKAGELISYVSDRFIVRDPVVLPRFTKALIKLGKIYLAKKYLFSMMNSRFMSIQAEGHIGLFEVLMMEGKPDIAIRYLYRVLAKYPGTRWELRARLLAVVHRKTLKKYYAMLGIKKIPSDDPIFNPIPNLKLIASKLIHDESERALAELIRILEEKIRENKMKEEEAKEVIDFIDEILPSFRVRKIAPKIKDEIAENLFRLIKTLSEKGKGIQALSLFLAHRDFFPPPYIKDYSFLKPYLAELGYPSDIVEKPTRKPAEEKPKAKRKTLKEITQEFEKAKNKEKFLEKNIRKYPALALKYAEFLVNQEKCGSALSIISKWRKEIMFLPEYNYVIFKIAYCLFMRKELKPLIYLCDMEKKNREFMEDAKVICGYPERTTYEAMIEKIFQDVERSAGELEKLKKELRK